MDRARVRSMPPVGASRVATVTARAGEDASLAGNARIGTLTARFRGVIRGDVASRVVGGFVTNGAAASTRASSACAMVLRDVPRGADDVSSRVRR